MLGLDERAYFDRVRDAYATLCSVRFDRYSKVWASCWSVTTGSIGPMIKALKASVDDDALRDEDGLISDEQAERDREQLRRQQAEESGMVLSTNGDGPAKSVEDVRGEARELTVKSLSGLHIDVAEFEVE